MFDWKYIYAVWKRKSSVAVVKLYPNGSWKFLLKKVGSDKKEKELKQFFGWNKYLYDNALASFKIISNDFHKNYDALIIISWWWISGISDAIRLAFARALTKENPDNRKTLKPYWLLSRDPRIKERKKPWLKKARKKPKRSKR